MLRIHLDSEQLSRFGFLLKAESCYQKSDLYYWYREYQNSQAEVDYVYKFNSAIVPIEVKAGTKVSMQSLYLFLKEKNELRDLGSLLKISPK